MSTPAQRAQRLADVLFRSTIPVVGLLFFQYDAAQMLLVFLFDTWMTLVAVSALQTLLMQRSTNDGAGNGRACLRTTSTHSDQVRWSFLF
jgi:hypothetical protein